MKKFIVMIIALLFITGCGDVELKDGEKAVVSFKDNEGISANELFDVLKEKYGAEELIVLVDTLLLEKEYDTTEEETAYINQIVSSVKEYASNSEMTFEEYILQNYNSKTAKEFNEYIKLNYRRSFWIEDYAKTLVTEAQIKSYYDNVAIGDITASHILIMSDAKEDATAEEKTAAENKALNTAKDLIKRLDKGEKFEDLAKEYSDDTASAVKGGALEPFNLGQMDANFEDAAIKLKVGKYSTTPVKSQYGYHIIYKISQADKDTLENLTDEIKKTLAQEMLTSNNSLYITAIKELRKKYDMDIIDSTLKNGYNDSMDELAKSASAQ